MQHQKKGSSSKTSSFSSKYKKVGETKDAPHRCVYKKVDGTGKMSKNYVAKIIDGKRKYKVYNGDVIKVQKGGAQNMIYEQLMRKIQKNSTQQTKKHQQAKTYKDYVDYENKIKELKKYLLPNIKNTNTNTNTNTIQFAQNTASNVLKNAQNAQNAASNMYIKNLIKEKIQYLSIQLKTIEETAKQARVKIDKEWIKYFNQHLVGYLDYNYFLSMNFMISESQQKYNIYQLYNQHRDCIKRSKKAIIKYFDNLLGEIGTLLNSTEVSDFDRVKMGLKMVELKKSVDFINFIYEVCDQTIMDMLTSFETVYYVHGNKAYKYQDSKIENIKQLEQSIPVTDTGKNTKVRYLNNLKEKQLRNANANVSAMMNEFEL